VGEGEWVGGGGGGGSDNLRPSYTCHSAKDSSQKMFSTLRC